MRYLIDLSCVKILRKFVSFGAPVLVQAYLTPDIEASRCKVGSVAGGREEESGDKFDQRSESREVPFKRRTEASFAGRAPPEAQQLNTPEMEKIKRPPEPP